MARSEQVGEKAFVHASTCSVRTVAECNFDYLTGHPELVEGCPSVFRQAVRSSRNTLIGIHDG